MMARTVCSKDELVALLRGRLCELNGTYEQVDEVAGFAERYCSKLLGPRPARSLISDSAFKIVGALGLRILIEDDADARRQVVPNYSRKRKIAWPTPTT